MKLLPVPGYQGYAQTLGQGHIQGIRASKAQRHGEVSAQPGKAGIHFQNLKVRQSLD
jgi:hypothetical protein